MGPGLPRGRGGGTAFVGDAVAVAAEAAAAAASFLAESFRRSPDAAAAVVTRALRCRRRRRCCCCCCSCWRFFCCCFCFCFCCCCVENRPSAGASRWRWLISTNSCRYWCPWKFFCNCYSKSSGESSAGAWEPPPGSRRRVTRRALRKFVKVSVFATADDVMLCALRCSVQYGTRYPTAQNFGDFASTVMYHGHKSKNAFSYEFVARLVVPILKHTKKCRLFRFFQAHGSVRNILK